MNEPCATCPFYTIPKLAQRCAEDIMEQLGIVEPHPCLEYLDILRPATPLEPVCVGHKKWLEKRASSRVKEIFR